MTTASLITATYVGGPTVLLEIGALRILTDPTFDPPGSWYPFGWGTGSRKKSGPAVAVNELGKIDAVLLSHDQHADNLDSSGREVLKQASSVVTTQAAAKRLKAGAIGLVPWETTQLGDIRVTAVPARHGPPLSRPIVGAVIGFVLQWAGQRHGALYISGDTVWFSGIEEIGKRFQIGTACLHLGGVRFPISGRVRYTFSAERGVKAAQALRAKQIVPLHCEGWSHFVEGRAEAEAAFEKAGLTDRVKWLPAGQPMRLEL